MKIELMKFGRTIVYEAAKHSPSILTGVSCAGVVTTAFMAGKATLQARDILEEQEIDPQHTIEVVKVTAPVYIPTIVMGTVTIGCQLMAHGVSTRRQAAMASMLAISETTMREFQDKATELYGERKAEKIREEVISDRLAKNPPVDGMIIDTGKGKSLCYDNWTGRYFMSDIDIIRRAELDLNSDLMQGFYVSMNDLYERIGLPIITAGEEVGWQLEFDGKLDLSPVWQGSPSNKDVACIVIDPHPGFRYGKE